jgi:hypothetical protein
MMAKRRPSFSLERMESDLGYKVDGFSRSEGSVIHFYADLRPIAHSVYERTLREFEALKRHKALRDVSPCGTILPELGVSHVRHPSA